MRHAVVVLALCTGLTIWAPGCRRDGEMTSVEAVPTSSLPPPSSAGPSDTEGHLSRDYAVAAVPTGGVPTGVPASASGQRPGPESEYMVRRPHASGPIGGRSYTPDAKGATCLSNVRQLDTGLLSYVQDWDERYPPGEHWAEGIGPYTRSPSLFKCPSDEREPSYAFNQALSRRPLSDLFEPAYTASLFESDDLQGVAYRHDRGAMYGFADGHARWIEKGWEKKEPVLWSLGEAGARGR